MSELHNDFYPIPLAERDIVSEGGIPEWEHLKSGFLSKDELIKLYNSKCGAKLHRGTAKNIMKHEKIDLNSIQTTRNKIVSLLNRHIITSKDEMTIYYFIMNNGDNKIAWSKFRSAN